MPKLRGLLVAISATCFVTVAGAAVPSGPNVGQKVPDFALRDQNGTEKTLQSILGPKGTLLVFYRSADW